MIENRSGKNEIRDFIKNICLCNGNSRSNKDGIKQIFTNFTETVKHIESYMEALYIPHEEKVKCLQQAHDLSQKLPGFLKDAINGSSNQKRRNAKDNIDLLNESIKRLEIHTEVLDKWSRLSEERIQLKATFGEGPKDKVSELAKKLTARIEVVANSTYEKIKSQEQSSNLEKLQHDCKPFLKACDQLHHILREVLRRSGQKDKIQEGSIDNPNDPNKELKRFSVVRFDEEASPDDQRPLERQVSSQKSRNDSFENNMESYTKKDYWHRKRVIQRII